jgi:hypothetical protein
MTVVHLSSRNRDSTSLEISAIVVTSFIQSNRKKETPRSARGLDSLRHKAQEFLPATLANGIDMSIALAGIL